MANNIMEILARAFQGENTQDVQIPFAPEAQEDAQLAQANENAMSPNLMPKEQLVEKEVQQELEKTPMGQVKEQIEASQVDNPIKDAMKMQDNYSKGIINPPRYKSPITDMARFKVEDEPKSEIKTTDSIESQDETSSKPKGILDYLTDRNRLDEQYQSDIKAARQSDAKYKMLANLVKSLGNLGAAEVQRKVGTQVGLDPFKPIEGPNTAGQLEKDRQSRLNKLKEEMNMILALEKNKNAGKITERDRYYNEAKDRRAAEAMKLSKEREGRIASQQQINTTRAMLKDNEAYKLLQKQQLEFDQVGDILKEAESGNQAAVAALGTKMARAMGEVGVLTDTDVVRYIQGTSWGRKLKDWYDRGMEGTLSNDTLADIKKNIGVIQKKMKQSQKKMYERTADRVQSAYKDMSMEDIHGILGYKPEQYKPQSNKVDVVLPNGQRGRIDADKVEAFKKKYPDAKVME